MVTPRRIAAANKLDWEFFPVDIPGTGRLRIFCFLALPEAAPRFPFGVFSFLGLETYVAAMALFFKWLGALRCIASFDM